jgi:hypothetical protein
MYLTHKPTVCICPYIAPPKLSKEFRLTLKKKNLDNLILLRNSGETCSLQETRSQSFLKS